MLAAVRAAVETNLHWTPMLRRVLHRTRLGEGGPVWVDPAVDISRHVILAGPDRPPVELIRDNVRRPDP